MSRVLAIDCEMVGSGNRSLLARVTIVNEYGSVVLDEYVKPTAAITDYRDCYSGINKRDLENGSDFSVVRNKVANLINGCTLVGHSLQFDLDALNLSHPESKRRDLATYEPLTRTNGGQPVALKTLASKYLGRIIQDGEHNSAEDAKACMDLYRKYSYNW
ncbi:unnamed protein product [Euphydryas editha]|uniref:RNA exonuclease 4 n=1 Tax=Euphydryas editha TaxID=104508 RepID=A0AAU9UU57_EUPED|nr:unnamed protein product [Euphydryas editha]